MEFWESHLSMWIKRHIIAEDQERAQREILKLVASDPELLGSHSWPEILDRTPFWTYTQAVR